MSRQQVPNYDLASDAARTNLLTNGGFEIWQRGNGPFTTHGGMTVDRWMLFDTGLTVTRETSVVDASSAASAKLVTSGTPPWYLVQNLNEQTAQLAGRTVSLSVRCWSNTPNALRLNLQYNGSVNTYSAYHTGNSTWQTLTLTIAIPAGATGLQIFIWLDLAATSYVDNAILVTGAVPADYAPLHPADDLARCLRYYELIGGGAPPYPQIATYAVAGAQAYGFSIPFKAHKPVLPTITKVGTWTTVNCGQPRAVAYDADGFHFDAVSTATGYMQAYNASAATYYSVEANP